MHSHFSVTGGALPNDEGIHDVSNTNAFPEALTQMRKGSHDSASPLLQSETIER